SYTNHQVSDTLVCRFWRCPMRSIIRPARLTNHRSRRFISPDLTLLGHKQRQNFAGLIRFSGVLSLSLLVVMLGGLVKPEAAVQPASFGAKTDFGTGSQPISVAVGDFNGDGKLDLAVANNANASTVSILLNNGDGTFGENTDFNAGDRE